MTQQNVPLEELLKASSGSIYKVTILAAKRAILLADGEKTLLVDQRSEKVLDNALREIEEGMIKVRETK